MRIVAGVEMHWNRSTGIRLCFPLAAHRFSVLLNLFVGRQTHRGGIPASACVLGWNGRNEMWRGCSHVCRHEALWRWRRQRRQRQLHLELKMKQNWTNNIQTIVRIFTCAKLMSKWIPINCEHNHKYTLLYFIRFRIHICQRSMHATTHATGPASQRNIYVACALQRIASARLFLKTAKVHL